MKSVKGCPTASRFACPLTLAKIIVILSDYNIPPIFFNFSLKLYITNLILYNFDKNLIVVKKKHILKLKFAYVIISAGKMIKQFPYGTAKNEKPPRAIGGFSIPCFGTVGFISVG